jgi:hypothetical protein
LEFFHYLGDIQTGLKPVRQYNFKVWPMKIAIYMIVLTALIASQNQINSQSVAIRESIDSINFILKANPYIDRFNEISFYYSVDITVEKELKVEMTFDGPFKWVYRAKISDMDITPKTDVCRESPGSLCWTCKKTSSDQSDNCVQAEMIYTDGSTQKENSTIICVSFSGQNMICSELNKRFQRLFSIVGK